MFHDRSAQRVAAGEAWRRKPAVSASALLFGLALVAAGMIGPTGCDSDSEDCVCCPVDREAPAAPRDLYGVTGDTWVDLYWLANTESDLDGYHILVGEDYYGDYELLATVDPCADCYWESYRIEGLANGAVYQFAVVAFDRRGNESPLSGEEVREIPRPEGFGVTLGNALEGGGDTAGFDFSAGARVAYDDPAADLWYEYEEGGVQLLVAGSGAFWPDDAAEIQDMGWTGQFDEIGFAPPDAGWSPSATAEAILEHTYVVLTRNGNYAKIRVTAVGPQALIFDWAYQTVPWERQLLEPRD
ncbi:MAG: hypothetical protein GF330_12515 [Candidatus Eisenbacteria bacterium]|nr:hypothetical protein [Candidatus Eisenbacteria bacterium]